MKELSLRHGFADKGKVRKKDKEAYKGHVGDVTGFLRIALSGSGVCPNLYYMIQILDKEKTLERINKVLANL
jgi:glutamyl-tRNA synthetase